MPAQNKTPSDQSSQIVERLRTANNVLITVSNNPSVDQLAACIGLTLALNKIDKQATAVFSGRVPSTLEFLQPDKTIERNTDSLRDFIISLDKSKADKLRYKVEDNVVKIFITPYRTSISDKDLEFTQGDFNVDAVVALGVRERADLDGAIVAHGRILHDATVISINTTTHSELGSINWLDGGASSLCEMVSDVLIQLDPTILDSQVSTALLTGLVAETDRFGNEKATPHTMSVSSTLMAAGASPQLIATKLQEPEEKTIDAGKDQEESEVKEKDGEIQIEHGDEDKTESDILIDEQGKIRSIRDEVDRSGDQNQSDSSEGAKEKTVNDGPPNLVLEPPKLGGQLTANSVPEHQQYSPSTDPLSAGPSGSPILNRDDPVKSSSASTDVDDDQTLTEIEKSLGSPHADESTTEAASEDTSVPPASLVEEIREDVEEASELSKENRLNPLKGLGTKGELDLEHEENNDQTNKDSPSDATSSPSGPPPPVPPPPILPS